MSNEVCVKEAQVLRIAIDGAIGELHRPRPEAGRAALAAAAVDERELEVQLFTVELHGAAVAGEAIGALVARADLHAWGEVAKVVLGTPNDAPSG